MARGVPRDQRTARAAPGAPERCSVYAVFVLRHVKAGQAERLTFQQHFSHCLSLTQPGCVKCVTGKVLMPPFVP